MTFTAADLKRVVWTFIQAFVASLVATASGWGSLPNYSTAKAAVISAGVAAIAAAIAFAKNLFLNDSNTGIHGLK